MELDQIVSAGVVTFGCDPEIFLLKEGKVIGSERVLPEEGLLTDSLDGMGRIKGQKKGIVLDGVQVELNPTPNACRALLGDEISAAFRTLKAHLSKLDGVSASFSQVVDVDPKELEGLSEKSKALGCAPSNNFYNSASTIGVNPSGYFKRSAGGHIHLGLSQELMKHRNRLVPLMDIFVGNTAVLMDRDPGNIERRKVYGRAGEHRLPTHGLEYRTLSNFWLRAYPLMSGVMGLSKFAVNVLSHAVNGKTNPNSYFAGAEDKIRTAIDLDKVQEAINTNNVELAKENWKIVSTYLRAHSKQFPTGIYAYNIDAFDYFVSKIDSDGIGYWFPDDPMTAWTTNYGNKRITQQYAFPDGHGYGWESFLNIVAQERAAKHVTP